ncbi:MAG: YCF48-related protein [Fuerstiella sp.]
MNKSQLPFFRLVRVIVPVIVPVTVMISAMIAAITVAIAAAGAPAAQAAAFSQDDTSARGSQPAENVRQNDAEPAAFSRGAVPRTAFLADDASLNDVCGVGSHCWAVGERGVIIRSHDGGITWTADFLPIDASLKSVCFLTDQIGYTAGSAFEPFGRRHRGVLWMTRDGGDSWAELTRTDRLDNSNAGKPVGHMDAAELPPLCWVRFFDLENAVAIASPDTPGTGSVVLRTADGGVTWTPLTSDQQEVAWCSADFVSRNDGVLVGSGNASAAVVADRLITLSQPQRSLRQLKDASLFRDGTGWVAGDGGLLLNSADGGVTWTPPAAVLAPVLHDVLDFSSVDHRGPTVCVAGSPGSIILHSADAGASWTFRQLNDPSPIHRLRFVADQTVLAVGAFGVIHRSEDQGLTWTTVRGAGYRAAVMCLTTNPEDISFRLLANISGDQGFRAVVVQPSARLPRDGLDDRQAATSLQAVLPLTGANVFRQDWMFSRTQPLQHLTGQHLWNTWGRQTDGRVAEILPQRLAQLIRIWRPDVLVVERSSDSDQVAQIMLQGLEPALKIAAGTDPRGGLLDKVGLAPWTAARTVVREPGTGSSSLSFRGDALLPSLATTTDLVAEYCEQAAGLAPDAASDRAESRAAGDSYTVSSIGHAAATPTHLLSGLMSAPGSAARRNIRFIDTQHREQLEKLTQQHRTQRAAFEGHLATAGTPLSLIAGLGKVGQGLPEHLALQQLRHLAALYESVDNLEGHVAVLREITERFPGSAEAADAAELLFQFYSSQELRFLRRRAGQPGGPADRQSQIRQAAASIPGIAIGVPNSALPAGNVLPANGIVTQPETKPGRGTLLGNSAGSDTSAVDAIWDANAADALQRLAAVSPERARSPRLLLRQAANARRQGTLGENSSLLSQAAAGDGLFALLARAELQAVHGATQTPVPVINLPRAASKPFLDGRLTEPVWQNAIELHLAASDSADTGLSPDCLLMFAWDEDHLYVGGRMEHATSSPPIPDRTAARRHDAAHGNLDRVQITFDVDRDYTTGFEFIIDQVGQTSERCWRAESWNPEWFLADDSDEQVWQFEAAIPQNELGFRSVRAGDLWAIRVQRLIPGVLQQSLANSDPEADAAGTNGFGLLRFIRNRQ